MRFRFHGVDQAGFDRWIAGARASGATLDRAAYLKLEQPSERNPSSNTPASRPACSTPSSIAAWKPTACA